jgi:hypothetical protein
MSCKYRHDDPNCRMLLTAYGDFHVFDEHGNCILKHDEEESRLIEAVASSFMRPEAIIDEEDA